MGHENQSGPIRFISGIHLEYTSCRLLVTRFLPEICKELDFSVSSCNFSRELKVHHRRSHVSSMLESYGELYQATVGKVVHVCV